MTPSVGRTRTGFLDAGGERTAPALGDVIAIVVASVCAVAVVFVPDGFERAAAAFVTVVVLAIGAVGGDAVLSAWRRSAQQASPPAVTPVGVRARVAAAAGRPGRSPMVWFASCEPGDGVDGDAAVGARWSLAVPLLSGVLAPGAVLIGPVVALSIGWRIDGIGAMFASSAGVAAPVPTALGAWLLTLVAALGVALLAGWAAPSTSQWHESGRRRVLGVPLRRGAVGFVAVAGDEFTIGLRALVTGAAVVALAIGAAPDGVVDFARQQPVAAAVVAACLAFVAAPGVEAAFPVGLVLAPFGAAAVVGFVVVCLVLDRRGAAAVAEAAGRAYAAGLCAVVTLPAVAVASVIGLLA